MFNDPVALTIHALMGRIEARGGGDGPGADRSSGSCAGRSGGPSGVSLHGLRRTGSWSATLAVGPDPL